MTKKDFSEINSAELRKFAEVWGPLVLSMPRVITAVDRVEELERHVLVLENRRDEASAEAARLKTQGEQDLANSRLALVDLNRERQEASQLVTAHKKACDQRIKRAEEEFESAISAIKSQVDAAKKEQLSTIQGLKAETDAARNQHAEEMRQMAAEIQDLVDKKATAQSALDEIKSRLG
jgi:hypothetical protein